MNPLTRRHFLAFSVLYPILTSCSSDSPAHTTKELTDLPMQAVSPDELELITNPLARPAFFAQHGLPPGPLEIRQRVFGPERGLLLDRKIENVRFSHCIFDGLQGYGNDLSNVVFDQCQFFGGVFSGERWVGVRFVHCAAEGRFFVGGRHGDVTCEDCDFRGMTEKEAGMGHWSDHFGFPGSFERSTFVRCKLANVSTGGSKVLHFTDCELGDLYANCSSSKGSLAMERCRATGSKLDFGGRGNDFARISIVDSQLGTVKMVGVRGDVLELTGTAVSLDIGGTRFGHVKAIRTTFSDEAMRGAVLQAESVLVENCTFGQSKGLQVFGKPNTQPSPGEGHVYWARCRTLTLRNTVVPKAEFAYLQVGTLTLDTATLENADLSHSRIGTLRLKNARLAGRIDLTDATIRRIENEGLVNSAHLIGKLEANPGAPEPEVEAPSPAATIATTGTGRKNSR